MPSAPCACAATLRPQRCASSTIASISAWLYCGAPTESSSDNTPAVAPNLITVAPYLTCSRTFSRTASIRSEEHTSELQSLMRISYAVFCLKKKLTHKHVTTSEQSTQQS